MRLFLIQGVHTHLIDPRCKDGNTSLKTRLNLNKLFHCVYREHLQTEICTINVIVMQRGVGTCHVMLNSECMWNIMAKRQTTLFGELLPLKRKHCILYVYNHSTDTYQKFVEVYANRNAKSKTKEPVFKEVQVSMILWSIHSI